MRLGQRGQPLSSQSRTKPLCPPIQSTQFARIAFKGEGIGSTCSWSGLMVPLPGDDVRPTWLISFYPVQRRFAAHSNVGFWCLILLCQLSGKIGRLCP